MNGQPNTTNSANKVNSLEEIVDLVKGQEKQLDRGDR